jgi:hypothetical protein
MNKNLLLLVMLLVNWLPGFAQSQTKTATLFNCFGEDYLNLWAQLGSEYVATDNNIYAYSKKMSPGRGSLQLLLQGFGFTIPSGTTIQNITVSMKRFETGKGSIRDYFAYLVRYDDRISRFNGYGAHWGDLNGYYPEKEALVTYSQSGSGIRTFAGNSQPYQWTPEMINDPAFGLRLNTYEPVNGAVTVYYDQVQITVHYSSSAVTRRASVTAETAPLAVPFAYPNPFTTSTRIRFTVAETGNAVVELFNIAGANVSTLFSGSVVQGQEYTVLAGEARLPKGIYVYRISNGKQLYTGRLTKLE